MHCVGNAYRGLGGRIHCRPARAGWVPVELPDPALEIAMLGGRVCARLWGGRVACWGEIYGVPEDRAPIYAWGHDEAAVISRARALEDRFAHSLVARVVSDLPPLGDVASTGHGTCALTRSGEVLCWGRLSMPLDLYGGPSEEYLAFQPTPIAGLPRGRALACTVGACFLWGIDRRLYHWGEGESAFELWRRSWIERGPIVELKGLGVSAYGGRVDEPGAIRCWAMARLGLGALPTRTMSRSGRRSSPRTARSRRSRGLPAQARRLRESGSSIIGSCPRAFSL